MVLAMPANNTTNEEAFTAKRLIKTSLNYVDAQSHTFLFTFVLFMPASNATNERGFSATILFVTAILISMSFLE